VSTVEGASVVDKSFVVFAAFLTAGVVAFLGWLLLLRQPTPGIDVDVRFLPAVNAGLNSLASCFLIAGFVAIRRGHRGVHKYLMMCALATTTLFLVSYVIYHSVHGDTPYPKDAPLRAAYLAILATHVLLSMVLPFLALIVVWLAWRGNFLRHKRLARVTLPIWLYVSVTGVLIYFMLDAVT
jgi:putative membrane protein